ncbi:MAG: DNA translocase FtsK [Bacteroidales bacterium]|nr:DNA translocase FtsK [Bacteroidales bacterium]
MVKKGNGEASRRQDFLKFIHSERFRKLIGICTLLFSGFLVFAILSFLFSRGAERNAMGALGWLSAKIITNKLFGIASLGLVGLLFLYGIHLVFNKNFRWWHIISITFFWVIWLSTTIGYICSLASDTTVIEHYAGIGAIIADRLNHLLRWGTVVLLIFSAAVFLVFVHHVHIQLPRLSSLSSFRKKENEIDTNTNKTENLDETPIHTRMLARIKNTLWRKGDNTPESSDLDDTSDNKVNTSDENQSDENSTDPPNSPLDEKNDGEGEVTFDIDDEFERINRRAQSAADTNTLGEPEFTIQEPVENTAQTDTPIENDKEEDTPMSDDPEDYARHFAANDLYDPTLELKTYEMPSTSILTLWEENNVKVEREELIANKDRIVNTLRDYGIEITGISASPGPTVTLYEIKPAPGIRISKIKSLEDDIALSLSALGIRIIAPIPGKGTIGIEVPNANPQVVSMKTMLESPAFRDNKKYELPIAIGKTISNEPFVTDLAKMPHLLMAGATGTGKSVGLNAVISSLLYKKHPAELKFVMVDPKKVELSIYSKIERHYLAKLPDSDEAIITDVKKVVRTLNSLCIEMDQRYDLLKLAQVRKITEYNDKFIHRHLNPMNGHRYLPYIVLVIDEFADLIMTAGKEVEAPICRLAQLARAVGIHLIIATQRPTTNIITGTIKANFPARIAFKVTSAIDSRTILDTSGAQRLIGRGDMLISLSGSDMVRLQCALIETSECEALVEHIANQRGYPDGFLLPEYLDENEAPNKDFDPKQKDEFFNDAAHLVFVSGFGSTSLLQRKLQLGFARAGRIIDQLEAAGIVGPPNGPKPRDLLIRDEETLNELLKSL